MAKGVYRTADPRKPYGAKVTHKGKAHYAGWFANLDDALRAVELKRVELGVSKPSPDLLIAHLLKMADHDAYGRYLSDALARIEAAEELGVSPFDLPEGWDLA